MLKQFKPAILLFLILAVITGLVYPFLVTAIAQMVFPQKANGSLIVKNGQVAGSELIGQSFDAPKYFWGRLSATNTFPYNAASSGGTNYSVMNPALEQQVKDRITALQSADPKNTKPVPVDLVTASASGLDPNISLAAARYQAERIARVRGIPAEKVLRLISQQAEGRQLGFLGEPRVNVFLLNLALDALQ